MAEAGSSSRGVPLIGAGFDTWGGSPFVQQRLALLGKTVFLLAFGFFAVMNGLLLAVGGLAALPLVLTQASLFHFLAAAVMVVLWLCAWLRPWSLRTLGLFDAGSLLLAGIGLAVKLIRSHDLAPLAGRDPELRLRRFEREARATAGLKSPHTVQLYDFGVTEDGTFYYVMELLDGLDLDTLVDQFGPVPVERAVHLLVQACASLEDAHQNGLVHRDIKPANIVVSRIGAAWDFVKVLDFGLVKLGSAPQQDEVKLSGEEHVSGTPGFIAPEVVLGAETDQRVDIYALGCVAYWLVTGQLVFDGPGAIKVMSDHIHTAPPPPSTRCPTPLPGELDQLILDCLAKEPAQRPASARELQVRLQAIPLDRPWTPERAEHWWSLISRASTVSDRSRTWSSRRRRARCAR